MHIRTEPPPAKVILELSMREAALIRSTLRAGSYSGAADLSAEATRIANALELAGVPSIWALIGIGEVAK